MFKKRSKTLVNKISERVQRNQGRKSAKSRFGTRKDLRKKVARNYAGKIAINVIRWK